MKRTVLVTGVSGYWGHLVARRLLAEPGLRVLGIDRRPLDEPLVELDFVKADVRNPMLAELLLAEQVSTVVHLAFRQRQWRTERDLESNVLGTMQLVGTCIDAGVRQVVLKSTTAVYGARPGNPMYLSESWPLASNSSRGHVRDSLEIEEFLAEFRHHYPEIDIAILRFPNIIGPEADSPLTRLLSLPAILAPLGFDPLLQVIDSEDVVSALVHAVSSRTSGAFNVAARGVVSLCKLAEKTGRMVMPVPHPVLERGHSILAATPSGRRLLSWFPIEPAYLRFPWIGDLHRMERDLGFEPTHGADEAVDRHARAMRMRRYERPSNGQHSTDEALEAWIASRQQQQDEVTAGLEP